jgi:hypothetical protein
VGLRATLLAWAVAAVAWLALPVSAAGQTTVQSALIHADLSPDDGGADVRVEYVLDVQGTPDLRFELLGFGPATTDAFWLGEARTGTEIPLDAEVGSMRAANFRLTLYEPSEPYRIVALYRIEDAVQRDGDDLLVRVPVLSLAFPPADGSTDLFRAELTLPAEWHVAEGFPTGLEADGEGSYVVELPVVPSMLGVRGRADGAWRPGLPLLIDCLMGAIMLAFGLVGWRQIGRGTS